MNGNRSKGTTTTSGGGGGGHPRAASTASSSSSSFPTSNYHWRNHPPPLNRKHKDIDTNTEATLTVTILSVYDLPYREPPSYVNLSMILPSSNRNSNNNSVNVRTGPPTQRHRDRNSFKFGNTTTPPPSTSSSTNHPPTATSAVAMASSNSNAPISPTPSSNASSLSRTLTITHSNLSELYHAMATFEVVYVTTTTAAAVATTPYSTTTTTTSFVSQYPLSKCHINETTWNILVCHTIPQSTSFTTNLQTGISNTIHHPSSSSSSIVPPSRPTTKASTAKPLSTASSQQMISSSDDPSEFTDTVREEDEVITPPTIRIQMTLTGPYRSEIRTILHYGKMYLQLLDHVEQSITTLPVSQWLYHHCLRPMGNLLFAPYFNHHSSNETTTTSRMSPAQTMMYWTMVFLILPLMVLVCLILIPVVTGIVMVTLPFMFPIVFLTIGILCGTSCTCFIYYCSSSNPIFGGRMYIYHTILYPILQTILSSKIGQHIVYDIGPRYQPIILLLHQYHIVPVGDDHNVLLQKLVYAILIDIVGSSSYLLPGLGECMDVVWAPVQTILIMALFSSNNDNAPKNHRYNDENPNAPSYSASATTATKNINTTIYQDQVNAVLPYVSFFEEILPFTDFIPTATIGWFCMYGIIPILAPPDSKKMS